MARLSDEQYDQWRAVAARLGLAFDPGGGWFKEFRMDGTVGGMEVDVHSSTSGGDAADVDWTHYTVRAIPLGLGLKIRERSGVGRLLIRGGIKTGDADFDRRCKVKGEDPDRVVLYLTPSRRAAILELMKDSDGRVMVDDDTLRCGSPRFDDPEVAEEKVRDLLVAAGELWS